MSLPVMAGIGYGLGGIGSVASAFGGSEYPQTLSPEANFALQANQQGMNAVQLNAGLAGQPFQQSLMQLGPQAMNDRQLALNSVLGGPQNQMQKFIQSAFMGQPTAADTNTLAGFDIASGKGQAGSRDQIKSALALSGLDPRSPQYIDQLSRLEDRLQSGYGASRGNLANQMAQQNLGSAFNMYRSLQTGPLAGQALLDVPQTPEQKYKSDYSAWQAERPKANLGDGGAENFRNQMDWLRKKPQDPFGQMPREADYDRLAQKYGSEPGKSGSALNPSRQMIVGYRNGQPIYGRF